MSNYINSISNIGNEMGIIISKLKEVNKEIIKSSELARGFSDAIKGAKTPSGFNDSLKTSSKNTEQLNALIKEQNKLERSLISTIAKKTLAQESTARAVTKEKEELKILNREQRNQLKAVSELSTAYEKLSAETNLLIREYKDLAIQQAKGAKLTDSQKKRLDSLGNTIKNNQKLLKDTDAKVGQFSRNVGNYASSWDGLGNSINQLTREAPAFAVSLQTGFLAISNNLPVLSDEIGRLIESNKALRLEGKPTQSVFKSLAGALFSFQTALSLGVTLLTIYGKDIAEFIQKTIQGGTKVRDLAQQQKILNETYKEGAKAASQEISQLQILLAVASDKTKSDQIRKKAVDKLISSSGGLVKEQDRLNILNGEAVKIENKLVKAILNKAIVQQLQSKISEDINKLLDGQIKIQKERLSVEDKLTSIEQKALRSLYNKRDIEKELFEERKGGILISRQLTKEEIERVNRLKEIRDQGRNIVLDNRAVRKSRERISEAQKENSVTQKNINNLIKEALKLTDEYTLSLESNTKEEEENNKSRVKRLVNLNESIEDNKRLFEALKETFSDNGFELDINLDKAKERLNDFTNIVANDMMKALDKQILSDAFSNLSNTIQDFTGANANVFNKFFEGIQNGFEDLPDIAGQSLDVIGEISNAFYNSSIENLDAQLQANQEYYDNILANEQLTDLERAKAEKDRETKEKEILKRKKEQQRKQAEVNKALAIADIILSTAKGIGDAASKVATIPLIPFIAGLGATQLAIAASTPIPKFKDGHLSGTHEGLAMINDASGSNYVELIERRSGEFETFKGRNQIINMEKGDKVHKAGSSKANEYFKSLTDEEIINNLNTHTMLANINNNMNSVVRLENKKIVNSHREQTDRLIKAISNNKPKIVLNNNNSIGEELAYFKRGDF